MNEFVTWALLGTFAGVGLVTSVIIHFSKETLQSIFPKVTTKAWTLLVSLILLIAVEAYNGSLSPDTIFMTIINAFVVATATMGTYDLTSRLTTKKEGE